MSIDAAPSVVRRTRVRRTCVLPTAVVGLLAAAGLAACSTGGEPSAPPGTSSGGLTHLEIRDETGAEIHIPVIVDLADADDVPFAASWETRAVSPWAPTSDGDLIGFSASSDQDGQSVVRLDGSGREPDPVGLVGEASAWSDDDPHPTFASHPVRPAAPRTWIPPEGWNARDVVVAAEGRSAGQIAWTAQEGWQPGMPWRVESLDPADGSTRVVATSEEVDGPVTRLDLATDTVLLSTERELYAAVDGGPAEALDLPGALGPWDVAGDVLVVLVGEAESEAEIHRMDLTDTAAGFEHVATLTAVRGKPLVSTDGTHVLVSWGTTLILADRWMSGAVVLDLTDGAPLLGIQGIQEAQTWVELADGAVVAASDSVDRPGTYSVDLSGNVHRHDARPARWMQTNGASVVVRLEEDNPAADDPTSPLLVGTR